MNDNKTEKMKVITLLIDNDLSGKLEKIQKKEKWSKALTYRKLIEYGIERYEKIQSILEKALEEEQTKK